MQHLIVFEEAHRLLQNTNTQVSSETSNQRAQAIEVFGARGHFDYTESGIMDRTHLRFFTFDSARKMLGDAGFEVLHVEPIFAFPTPVGLPLAQRLGRNARASVRTLLARFRPRLFARQVILVGRRRDRAAVRSEPPSSIAASG